MLTKNSKIGDLVATPIGSDILNTLFLQTGLPSALVYNPASAQLKLSALGKIVGEQMVDTIINLVNTEKALPRILPSNGDEKWWKEAVFYQIYPRSFNDSNGDGVGDLRGIINKIPYLKELGVNVIWLSPIYASPNDDNGYDISDYRAISPEYGTMADFDELLNAVHSADMRLIMDLVVNHTSDEHEWFKKALQDKQCPEHDYYIWQDGTENVAPNNWRSFFSGSAWTWYSEVQQWGLHLFSKKQMDLNWDNPNLRKQIYSLVNFWYAKGIDGFRMDVINLISKSGFNDGCELLGKATGLYGIEHYFYGPNLHEYLRELRQNTVGDKDLFTVGETPAIGMQMSKLLTDEARGELDMVFNFDHFENPGKNRFSGYKYDLNYLKKYYINWQKNYANNCTMSLVIENHDNPRIVSKIEPQGDYREEIAKLMLTLQATLKGTPFIYEGQELGIPNTQFTRVEELCDVESINKYNELLATNTAAEAFNIVKSGSRDNARTPMPWTSGEGYGFTSGKAWLRFCDKANEVSVENQELNDNSVLEYTKKLFILRAKDVKCFAYGEFLPTFVNRKNLFCYFRTFKSIKYYVECNLCNKDLRRAVQPSDNMVLCVSNYYAPAWGLRPYEVNVYKVEP